MLSKTDNETLCRVGPGTPMGHVFRRFWNPVALTEQAPDADGAPVRLEMLGEQLVLFRDSSGRLGLLDEACIHRGVSLALGRVEQGGIRCLYHGWKFDIHGSVQETPNHPDLRHNERIKATAYPLREAGGFIWAYMGPPEREPPFPGWKFFDFPSDNVRSIRLDADVNYMQQLEGGTDTSHVGVLHSNFARPTWMTGEFQPNSDAENPATLATDDLAPELELEDTEFGFHYAAFRKLRGTAASGAANAPDQDRNLRNVRVVPVIMPSTRVIPAPAMQFLIFEVPINDTRTATFGASYRMDGGPIDKWRLDEIGGRHDPELFCKKTYQYKGNWANRFGQRPESMDDSWSGIKGVVMEDLAIASSQGPIVDRSKETLVAADKAVVRARKQLLESARRVAAGGDPIGVSADVSGIVACDENLPDSVRWQQLVPAHKSAPPIDVAPTEGDAT